MSRICIVPRVEGAGGMTSFRLKFEAGLRARGVDVTHDFDDSSDAILVIAGTRNLLPLWRAKRRGLRVVQRLDGINWVQRARWTGARYHLRAEYGNALLAFIRSRFADRVIYQSRFIRGWWEKSYGAARAPASVILNGVDLNVYSPAPEIPAHPPYRLLVVEGSLAGGLDTGLRASVRLAEILSEKFPLELLIAGRVDAAKQKELTRKSRVPIRFLGVVPREQIPELDRSAHLLFSAEINPPCPNSVIEALACGLPVVGFDTGSFRELVFDDAGRSAPYGGDPWKLDPPDVPALASAAEEVLNDPARFRKAARARAEAMFDVKQMVDEYLKVLLE